MRIFVLCCNYHENELGHLPDTLRALEAAKRLAPDTVVAVVDNHSEDGSVELLTKYHESGTVNLLLCLPKNVGKALAINILWKQVMQRFTIYASDLVLSLDSDIELLHPDFFARLKSLAGQLEGGFSAIVPVLRENNIHTLDFSKCERLALEDDTLYLHRDNRGVAGPAAALTVATWLEIGGYRTDSGKDGRPAIYGTDDFLLFYDACKHNDLKPIAISEKLECRHPATSDPAYQAWKDLANRLAHRQFGGSQMLDTGYFEGKRLENDEIQHKTT